MRGGKIFPIWERPYPTFFWEFDANGEKYDIVLRQRVVYTEWRRINHKMEIWRGSSMSREEALLIERNT